MRRLGAIAAALVSAAPPAFAVQAQDAPPLPQPVPIVDSIPAAVDRPFAGTITLDIDARDAPQGVFRATETIPVTAPGPMVLLYPKWRPGNHAPSGVIKNLAGLVVTAGGRRLAWRRDPIDVYAFHIDVPAGAKAVEASFQYLSPPGTNQDRRIAAPTMLDLQWESMSLYPAGWFVRNLPVRASVTYPTGWTAFSALRGKQTGARVVYDQAPYDVLVDSPVFAGLYTKRIALDPAVSLDIVADTPDLLAITPDQIARHKAVVEQADRLFGTRHFDHYDSLLALSAVQSGIGLEHHRSSENGLSPDLFTDWAGNVARRDTLPHEFTHSWNGKFRRPADLWTPDYRMPMRDSLLWVYEGQTQFWGDVLAARSGMWSRQEFLDSLAHIAAEFAEGTPGDRWRPLQDTTSDPIITAHGAPGPWPSWSRGYDYYSDGALLWLDVDQTMRRLSGGARGLDDFARAFFGVMPGVWDRELTYTFDDVVAALNRIQPHDWAGFLRQRLDATDPKHTLDGITQAGYRLIFTDVPGAGDKGSFTYSLGLTASANGRVGSVLWDGSAARAGIAPGDTVVAVTGTSYSPDALAAAITTAKGGKAPIALLIQSGARYRTVAVDYHGGLRYPHLEKAGPGEAGLDRLLAPR